jgi:N-methylhydantoinase A/oxoprolinase/acetone carboxylase beta subunit
LIAEDTLFFYLVKTNLKIYISKKTHKAILMILGIDVGGTHTDAVLVENFELKKKVKVPTDNANIMSSLLSAAQKIISGENINNIKRIVLSTTISTNAIIQNKIDRVAMVLLGGPGLAPSTLSPGKNAFFISGYINHRGVEVQSLNSDEIRQVSQNLQLENIRQIGIVGKFSTRNPQQELDVAGILENDQRQFSLGHRLSGRLNFPRRIATTYLNAAINNIYGNFINEVKKFVCQVAGDIPVYILKADGGTILIDQSLSCPVQTIHSGPAASIMGLLATAQIKEDAVALDIGGTTTDISVFAGGDPLLEPSGITINEQKTLIRGLYTKSIGVGGDSSVCIENGEICIGPERRGPAAALGGEIPTPTDAMIILDITVLGSKQKAMDAIAPLAQIMNLDIVSAARAILDKMVSIIADNVKQVMDEINDKPVYTIHELMEGKTINPEKLYVVGGPAALAPNIAKLLGYPYKIPEHSEVANALGAALARTTAEITILADTEKRELIISEEGTVTKISRDFTLEDAISAGKKALRQRAEKLGADPADMVMEVTEAQEFNMIRDFYKTGKNIRAKIQIKPGLISAKKT